MKMRVFLILVVMVFLAGPIDALAHHGPETIEINKIQKSMAPVTFEHFKHQDRVQDDCTVCHHKGKADEEKQQPCSDCHGKVDEAPGYKDAMHKKCQGCHKEKVVEGMNPPVKCAGCHVKK